MLLILVGALGTAVLVLRAGDQVAAIKVNGHVAAGERIPEGSLEQVMMPEDSEVNYVRWDQRDQLAKYHAVSDIVTGSLLVGDMIDTGQGLESGQTVVGLSLQPGQYPNSGLRPGATVAAYFVGDTASSSSDDETGSTTATTTGDILAAEAKVQRTDTEDDGSLSGGTVDVTLLVDEDEAGALLAAASEQEVAVSLVSGGN